MIPWTQVSPSQIEAFEKCQRSWHFRSILRVPEPQKPAQALGSAMHRILEVEPQGLTYEPDDVPAASPAQWDIARQLADVVLPILPPTISRRESQITLDTYPGGPRMLGYLDFAIEPGHGWPALGIPADLDLAVIGDFKTTSDFRYMKTPGQLAESVQMMTYAKWAIEPVTGLCSKPNNLLWGWVPPERIALVHVYARTKKPYQVRWTVSIVTRDAIMLKWERTLDTIRKMAQIAQVPDTQLVEATGAITGHCQAYGGCQHRATCGLDTTSSIAQLFRKPGDTMSEPKVSTIDRIRMIREQQAAKNATLTASAAAPASEPVEPVKTAEKAVSSESTTSAAAPAAMVPPGLGSSLVDRVKAARAAAAGAAVVPPDAPPRDQAPETVTRPDDPAPAAVVINKVEVLGPPDAAVGPIATEPPKRGRGRPPKVKPDESAPTASAIDAADVVTQLETENAKLKAVRDELGALLVTQNKTIEQLEQERGDLRAELDTVGRDNAETVELLERQLVETQIERDHLRAQLEQERSKAPSAAPAAEGLTIYVDCMPTKSTSALDLAEWLAPIAQAVAESNSVSDYRLIPYTSRGLLASAIREMYAAEPLTGALLVSSSMSGSDVALEVLTPLARQVVRALRG